MAYREMTGKEIAERIARGDLVVYLDEEYGFRQWFWFPDMTEEELLRYWHGCSIENHYFNPSGLPGDMVPVPADNTDDDAAHNCPTYISILTDEFDDATEEEREKMVESYIGWEKKWYPNYAMWSQGSLDINCWRAHAHMKDDSYLKKPGE